MKSQPAPPRPAATLVLVRDSIQGLEVFMMRRSPKSSFLGDFHVFPGGAVDADDDFALWVPMAGDFDDARASCILNLERGGFAYWLAAIRECFEEAGLLLAQEAGGELVRIDTPERIAAFAALREQLNDGTLGFRQFLAQQGLRPAFEGMAYFSHWLAPKGTQPRFDTRFFVAVAPPAQEPSHDQGETVAHAWLRPEEALARRDRGEFQLILPTAKTLELLAQFGDCATLLTHFQQSRSIPMTLPRRATGRDGPRSVLPQDYAYAEVGKLDPEGHATASYEIIPGVPVRLSPRLRRLTAPNPGFMTGPGTNSYLLGNGDQIAVIDPGPDLPQHVDLLIQEARGANGTGQIRWILATHTHSDHSPAAARLKALTGAELIGLPPPGLERQDQSFQPDRIPGHGERLAIAGCTLRVIHTPGHASNHLCYLLEEEKILFAGDHLMQGSTVVINPPDGDMGAYLESLREIQREDIDYVAPGHGFLMEHHQSLIDALLAHRQQREEKILTALQQAGPGPLEHFLPLAYADVPAHIHPLAARSLLAHLLKLKHDGRAREQDGIWSR
ncbi:MAG: MBL fold metallo-hydrolase [Rhodocyclaceae bacterium]|jgi:glyoxylase-like metal-dependent hydrolase (beta-lactamase superfamily II)/8-oxo-dGTP pyrophosphatase MutT (NUDIX family)|nr:MBL fold metallo-hydrolase [Rhodocyclaceae bacterium]